MRVQNRYTKREKEENTMKKILSVILCLALALGLAAPAVAEDYTAGTYTASADGNNGPVTVEVDFDDSAITAVRVTEHAETAGICETPSSGFPPRSWKTSRWRWTRSRARPTPPTPFWRLWRTA